MQPLPNPYPEIFKENLEKLGTDILTQQNKLGTRCLEFLLEGHTQVDNLIAEVDILLYLLKHELLESNNVEKFIMRVVQLLEVMEYEIEIFNDTKANYATKYMLIEKLHISNNKIQDIYSVTKYPHRLFNLSFEKKFKKHKYLTKGCQLREDGDKFYDTYYKTYLEDSLDSQLEARNDFDSYLNELFPNHEQHLELMIRILYLLSSSIKIMSDFVKSKPEGSEDRSKASTLINKLEFRIQIIMMA